MMLPDSDRPSRFRLETSILSDVGRQRSRNEDYAMAYLPDDPVVLEHSGCLFIVADGEGETTSGEEASRYAAGQVFDGYYDMVELPPEERLRIILREVGNDLYYQPEGDGFSHGMTTMVAASVLENHLTIASVGNSRAYLVHDGQAQQITRDHNQISELFNMGELSVEEVESAGGQNKLTRSLGGQPDVEVDIFTNIPIFPGDLLLLCSDGLPRYVSDEQIAQLIQTGSLDQISQRLVNQAIESGGEDNITVLLVLFRAVERALPEADQEELRALESGLPPVPNADPAKGKQKPAFQIEGKRLVLLGAVIVGLILVWFIWQGVRGLSTTEPTPLFVVTDTLQPENILPAQATPLPSPTSTRYVETPEVATPEPGLLPQVDTTVSACVWPVEPGQTLFSIIRGFELAYNPEQEIAYYPTCDLEQSVCSGELNVVETHASISPGWNIVIPVNSKEACQTGQGYWVRVGE